LISYNISILGYGSEETAKFLAKKGTSSDISFYNNTYQGRLINICVPSSYPEKISSLVQAVEFGDSAIIVAPEKPDYSFGEIILLLDFLKKPGCFYQEKPYYKELLIPVLAKSWPSNYPFFDNINDARDWVFSQKSSAENESLTVIDHFFMIKGVGLVILGSLKKGLVKSHDKIILQPSNKEVQIKSIQVHDENYNEVQAPSRVGYLVKGVELEELKRGMILSPKKHPSLKEITVKFTKNPFFKKELKEGQKLTISCGEQVCDADIKSLNPLILKLDKEIALYTDKIIIFRSDLREELRIAGFGEAVI